MVNFFRWTFRAFALGLLLGVIFAFAPGCALTDMTGETYVWTAQDQRAALEAEVSPGDVQAELETSAVYLANDGSGAGQDPGAPAPKAEADDRSLWEVLAEFWSSPPVLVLRMAATIAGFVI